MKNDTKLESRFDQLDRLIAEGNLLRGSWTEGQERACLLAALSPEVATEKHPSACPASLMPPWLAYLTPAMDDNGSREAWPAMVRRYAQLARRWAVLGPIAWGRLDQRARAAVVSEAHAASASVAAGGVDAAAVARAANAAANAFGIAAGARVRDAGGGALACHLAYTDATAAAWDRMTAQILDAIEEEIELAERAAAQGPGVHVDVVLAEDEVMVPVQKEVSRG